MIAAVTFSSMWIVSLPHLMTGTICVWLKLIGYPCLPCRFNEWLAVQVSYGTEEWMCIVWPERFLFCTQYFFVSKSYVHNYSTVGALIMRRSTNFFFLRNAILGTQHATIAILTIDHTHTHIPLPYSSVPGEYLEIHRSQPGRQQGMERLWQCAELQEKGKDIQLKEAKFRRVVHKQCGKYICV